jgi:hypothetical protein
VYTSRQLKVPMQAVVAEITTLNAKKDLTTVYRAFMRVAGPHLLLRAVSAMWRNYVAFAEASVVRNDQGFFVGDCHGMPFPLMDWACGGVQGFLTTAIEMAGGHNCESRVSERGIEPNGELAWFRTEVRYK